MSRARHTTEQIVNKLRQADVELAKGQSVSAVCTLIGVTDRIVRHDEAASTGRVVGLAAVYGRYGTPRITALLRREGWSVNHKRVERVWRQARRCRRSSRSVAGCGPTTAVAFGRGPRGRITCGRTTS